MAATASSKIERYEELLNEQLKVELQSVHDERDSFYDKVAQCLELRNNVKMLQEQNKTSLKTMVNLGSDFYVQAKVPDTSKIYVCIGLGFHAELTLDEAVAFCNQREKQYTAQADALTERAAKLKARIKLVLGAIDELQQQTQLSAASRTSTKSATGSASSTSRPGGAGSVGVT